MAYSDKDIISLAKQPKGGRQLYDLYKGGQVSMDSIYSAADTAGIDRDIIDSKIQSFDTKPPANTPVSLNNPPAVAPAPTTTAATQPTSQPKPTDHSYFNTLDADPKTAVRQVIEQDGQLTPAEAGKIYSLALNGDLNAQDLAEIGGVDVSVINNWLTKRGLSLDQKPDPANPGQSAGNYAPDYVTGEVPPEASAGYQLMELLKSNSPYIRQAELQGERYAAGRGMLDSNIAASSVRAEAQRQAAPLAINDANTHLQMSLDNIRRAQEAMNLSKQLKQSERENIRSNETSRLNQLAQNETQVNVAKLGQENQRLMAEFEAKHQINVNDINNRSTAYNNMTAQIGNIEADPNLTAAQKSAAINRTVTYYENYLDYLDILLGKTPAANDEGGKNTAPAPTPEYSLNYSPDDPYMKYANYI